MNIDKKVLKTLRLIAAGYTVHMSDLKQARAYVEVRLGIDWYDLLDTFRREARVKQLMESI